LAGGPGKDRSAAAGAAGAKSQMIQRILFETVNKDLNMGRRKS